MSLLFPNNPKFEVLYKEMTGSVNDISNLFAKMIHDFKNCAKYAKQAQKIEEQADNVTHRILLELNNAFITPFDRDDMFQLVMDIDSIIDNIENIFHMLSLYEVKKKNQSIDQFAELFIESAQDLDKLIFLFFDKKHDIEKINKMMVAIHKDEQIGDEIYINAIKDLFKKEKNPIELIKWKEIVEELERISDKFKDITDTVVNALMKNG